MGWRREVSTVVTPCAERARPGPLTPSLCLGFETWGVAPVRGPQSARNLDLPGAWGVGLGPAPRSPSATQPRASFPWRPRVGTRAEQRAPWGAGRGRLSGRSAAGRAGLPGVPRGFGTCKARRAALRGLRSTCLAPRWRSRTSHLSSSYLKKHLEETRVCVCACVCVCARVRARGGPQGGPGPGGEAEGGRLGGWMGRRFGGTAPF